MRLFFTGILLLFVLILEGQVYFNFSFDKNFRGINDVFVASNHDKYVASDSGVVKYINNGVLEYYKKKVNELPSNFVNAIAEDAEGGMWFGTDNGLARLFNGSWTIYSTQNSSIRSDKIFAIHIDKNIIYIGTDKGISSFAYLTNTWIHYHSGNTSIKNDTILSISFHKNKIYAGTPGGIFISGHTWQHFHTLNSALESNHILHIKKGGDFLYINTADGIYFLRRNSIEKVEHDLGPFLIAPENSSIITDPDGNLYTIFWYELNVQGPPIHYIMKYNPDSGSEIFYIGNLNLFITRKNFYLAYEPVLKTIHIVIDRPGSTVSNANNVWVYFLPDAHNSTDIVSHRNLKYLDINKVKAGFHNDGTLHYLQGESPLYNVPYDKNDTNKQKNTVFATDFWVAGTTEAGIVKKSHSTYGNQIYSDYRYGPIDHMNPESAMTAYNKVWKINKDIVEEYKAYYYGGGDTSYFNYQIPNQILDWPGNHPDGGIMAPFFDSNNDGFYDPYNGDYPEIKGDQMVWWVFNDMNRNNINEAMTLEFYVAAYAFHCPDAADSSDVIEKSTFYEITMKNKGNEKINEVFAAVIADVEIGYAFDDYTGGNQQHHYGFFYNGDNHDFQFGENPPMMNYVILKGPKADENDGIDNNKNGVIDESDEHNMLNVFRPMYKDFSICGFPESNGPPVHYYNYMKGLVKNGDTIRRNGYGCYGGDIPTTFQFDGVPYADTGWTEMRMGITPSNRRSLLGSGPFSIAPGETRSIEYAIVYTRNTTGPNGLHTSIKTNHEEVLRVINWHNTRNYTGCTPSYPVDSFKLPQFDELMLYPNPANDKITISYTAKEEGAIYTIFDMQGRVRTRGKMNRYPFQELDIYGLETGTYIIRVVDAENVFIRKFVKAP